MSIHEWLQKTTRELKTSGIGTARLDALVLLEDGTGWDRSYLLAHPEIFLQDRTLLQKLNKQIDRRLQHEPLAYIRGKTEFYGREFIVNKDVLEPRPESETMIELLKEHYGIAPGNKMQSPKVLDVGTGSGALGITAKLEIPGAEVLVTDIDPACLGVARKNAKKYFTDISFLQGDLLDPLQAKDFQLLAILANLPYVPDGYSINRAASMEPRRAIFGGSDGLDLYRQLFEQLNRGEIGVQFVFTESLPDQHAALAGIAHKAGFKLQKSDDFIQVFTSF